MLIKMYCKQQDILGINLIFFSSVVSGCPFCSSGQPDAMLSFSSLIRTAGYSTNIHIYCDFGPGKWKMENLKILPLLYNRRSGLPVHYTVNHLICICAY